MHGAHLRKSVQYNVKNLLKKDLREGAGDPAQALDNPELQLGEGTLGREKEAEEHNTEKTLSPRLAIDVRVAGVL